MNDDLAVPSRVTIYTDGACSRNPGPGGWAVLFILGDAVRYISGFDPHTTNNKMELYAAIVALRTLTKSTSVDLYTDSRYLQDGINNWVHSWQQKNWRTSSKKQVLNQDLWKELIRQARRHDVHWEWVRAHSTNPFNNFVDMLARNAISNRDGVDARINMSQLKASINGRQISR
jgi:ribonuclease HI